MVRRGRRTKAKICHSEDGYAVRGNLPAGCCFYISTHVAAQLYREIAPQGHFLALCARAPRPDGPRNDRPLVRNACRGGHRPPAYTLPPGKVCGGTKAPPYIDYRRGGVSPPANGTGNPSPTARCRGRRVGRIGNTQKAPGAFASGALIQLIRLATTTRRPLLRVYSQVERHSSLSPYSAVMPVS